MGDKVYVLGDADQVGKRIEGLLLSGNLKELGRFSTSVTAAIQGIRVLAEEKLMARVVFSGGDEILFLMEASEFREESVQGLRSYFLKSTGGSISFGIGGNPEEAFLSLARAKSNGSGLVIYGRRAAGGRTF